MTEKHKFGTWELVIGESDPETLLAESQKRIHRLDELIPKTKEGDREQEETLDSLLIKPGERKSSLFIIQGRFGKGSNEIHFSKVLDIPTEANARNVLYGMSLALTASQEQWQVDLLKDGEVIATESDRL